MTKLTYTLVTDGTSDECLMHVINWLLARELRSAGTWTFSGKFANYRDKPQRPKGLLDRLRQALHEDPCDLLFVHRDAESEDPLRRRTEILNAAKQAGFTSVVCIVPVRMTEAWMLIDEAAIRRAAGNPSGRVKLALPPLQKLEGEPDPKERLEHLLMTASEASGRRLKQFERDLSKLKPRVAELIEDYSPLQRLRSFRAFEQEVKAALSAHVLRISEA